MALPGGISALAVVAVIIIGVGVVLHIVGLATPEWSVNHVDSRSRTIGLWKECGGITGTDADELANSLRACEAFAILGMLASFVGVAMAALSVLLPMMGKPQNAMFPLVSLAGCVAAFVCILIAVCVWGAIVHVDYLKNFDIGYSFILSIIGGILIVAGGILARLGNK